MAHLERPTDAEEIGAHDIYAHFGLAMYAAQCVERQIAIIAPMLLGMHPERTTRSELDELWNMLFSVTMGQALRHLERSAALPKGFEDRLRRALELRNWLAHDYFWERAGHFASQTGRDKMRTELSETAAFLNQLDADLVDAAEAWRRSVGVSDEIIAAEINHLIEHPDSR